MEITAAVLRAPQAKYGLEQVELAEPGPGQVLVRIAGTGMCHTDVAARRDRSSSPLPMITGHEGAGVVEAIGDDITTLEVGDHVVLTFDSCGICANCAAGIPAYCEAFLQRNGTGRNLDGTTGVTDSQGHPVSSRWFGQSSFATHAVANERNAVKVDRSLPLEVLGPLGCSIQTGAGSVLVAMDVQPGSSIVVFGVGAVGLAAVMASKIVGAANIIAVDLQAHRRDLALELGATHALDGAAPDVVEQIQKITGGGANCTFDTTGVPSVVTNALKSLRMGGVCGLVGLQTGPIVLDERGSIGKTIMNIIQGGVDPQTFIPRMIGLWQDGEFPFDRLIETFPLADINEAEASSLGGGTIKPVLIP